MSITQFMDVIFVVPSPRGPLSLVHSNRGRLCVLLNGVTVDGLEWRLDQMEVALRAYQQMKRRLQREKHDSVQIGGKCGYSEEIGLAELPRLIDSDNR